MEIHPGRAAFLAAEARHSRCLRLYPRDSFAESPPGACRSLRPHGVRRTRLCDAGGPIHCGLDAATDAAILRAVAELNGRRRRLKELRPRPSKPRRTDTIRRMDGWRRLEDSGDPETQDVLSSKTETRPFLAGGQGLRRTAEFRSGVGSRAGNQGFGGLRM